MKPGAIIAVALAAIFALRQVSAALLWQVALCLAVAAVMALWARVDEEPS